MNPESTIADPAVQGPAVQGLRQYVRRVTDMMGLAHDSCYVQSEPLSVYVAVEGHIPGFPGRDVALLWDERHGWAGALETGCGEDFIVVSYLGDDPLPDPRRVADYTAALLRGEAPGTSVPPEFRVIEVLRGLRWTAWRAPSIPGTRLPQEVPDARTAGNGDGVGASRAR